jgi:hypothetical protein
VLARVTLRAVMLSAVAHGLAAAIGSGLGSNRRQQPCGGCKPRKDERSVARIVHRPFLPRNVRAAQRGRPGTRTDGRASRLFRSVRTRTPARIGPVCRSAARQRLIAASPAFGEWRPSR